MEHPVVISSRGRVGQRGITFPSVRRVQFPTFDIIANPTIQPMTIPRSSIFEMQYKYQIQEAEDEEIFKTLDSIANSGNKDI
jgi:hypothetical protein